MNSELIKRLAGSRKESGGARLSQPQHVRTENPWNFMRSIGNPSCCGWDTRAPMRDNLS
jgi:hypothetical protein